MSTITDPVCGMKVDSESRHGAEHAGEYYYFCSQSCLDKFKANPAEYLKQVVAATAQTAAEYTCPMHPEVRQAKPGSCPKCGMALEPVASVPAKPDTSDHTKPVVAAAVQAAGMYTCPMHPEVRQAKPGSCPKCGMALEPESPSAPGAVEYTCPMHPQIVRSEPGSCPICGMALEPRNASAEDNAELNDMTRRFWVSVVLALPVFLLAMAADLFPSAIPDALTPVLLQWLEFALATPVVLWGGWPIFQRGWASVVNRHLNMFTLIALGVGVAWTYSMAAMLLPGSFPPAMRSMGGSVPVYFEAAAVIMALVLLGQVMELRARSQTSAAIKLLLGLAPKTARIVRADGKEEDIPSAAG